MNKGPDILGQDLDQLPDVPDAVNHPVFQKLELVSGIIFRRQSPVVIGADELSILSNELLISNTKNEAFLYNTFLAEFLRRVAKGVISIQELEANFSENSIKEQVMNALNLLVDSGNLKIISKEPSSPPGIEPQKPVLDCTDLENLISDILNNDLLTIEEIQKGIRNRELYDFFHEKFVAEQRKPTFIARYFQPPAGQNPANPQEITAIERAHTYFDLSAIAADIEEQRAHHLKPGAADQEPAIFFSEEPETLKRSNRTLTTNITVGTTISMPAVLSQPVASTLAPSTTIRPVSGVAPPAHRDTLAHAPASKQNTPPTQEALIQEQAMLSARSVLSFEPAPAAGAELAAKSGEETIVKAAPDESKDLAEQVKIPGLVVEITPAGDENILPLLIEGEVYSIGTDPINEYVIDKTQNPKIEPVHGLVFARAEKVFLKAAGAPMKLEKERFEIDENGKTIHREYRGNNFVLRNAEKEVEPGRIFHLMPKGRIHEDPTPYPCFTVKDKPVLTRAQIKEALRQQFLRLMSAKAELLFNLLREKDPAVSHSLLALLSDLEGTESGNGNKIKKGKLERIDETASRYGIEIFSADERQGVIMDNLYPIAVLINNAVTRYLKEIAGIMYRQLSTYPPDILARPVTAEFIKNNDQCALPVKRINELLSFARAHGIPVMDMERAENLRDQVIAALEKRRAELLKQHEEDVRIQKEQTEKKLQEMREQAERINAIKARYAAIHLGEEEILDENTKFAYVGPAILITDAIRNRRVDPFLMDEVTLGSHPANTHQLLPKKGIRYKYKMKPFMAQIKRDKDEFIMTWIDGDLEFVGSGRIVNGPIFRLEKGNKFRLGAYFITIEDNHAYSEKALKEICPSLAKELIEVIFNVNETGIEQDQKALQNLETLVERGYLNQDFLENIVAFGLERFMDNIFSWDINRAITLDKEEEEEEPDDMLVGNEHMSAEGVKSSLQAFILKEAGKNKLQDANYLQVVKMLLDISVNGRFFNGLSTHKLAYNLKAEAMRRAAAYCAVDKALNEEQAKQTILERLSSKRKQDRLNRLNDLSRRAAAGVIQIAKLDEMELLDLDADVAPMANASLAYIEKIKDTLTIRALLNKFEKGNITIDEIHKLKQLGRGIKVNSVLSDDEMELASHNLSIRLKETTTIESFISTVAIYLGRKAFRDAINATDPRMHVAIISNLMETGLLKDMDLVQVPELLPENIKVILAELKTNAEYLEQRDKLRIEHTKQAKEEMLEMETIAINADKIIWRAAREKNLEIMLDVADLIADEIMAQRMERFSIKIPTVENLRPMPGFTSSESAKNPRLQGIINLERGWNEIRAQAKKNALELAKAEAQKVLACDDAIYRMIVIDEAVKKGLISYEDLGITREEMSYQVEAKRALKRKLFEENRRLELRAKYDSTMQIYESELDNLDYLKEIKLETLTDPLEREIALEAIKKLNERKLVQIRSNISNGEDVRYMRILEKEITEWRPVPDVDMAAEKLY